MKRIGVLGTGNIAQTVAVDLKSNGHEVRLFAPDYLISRIQKIVDTHEIECVGVFEAKEKIDSFYNSNIYKPCLYRHSLRNTFLYNESDK